MHIELFKKICKKHKAKLVKHSNGKSYSLALDGVTVTATAQEVFAHSVFESFQMLVYRQRCQRPTQPSVLAFERDFIHFDDFLANEKTA